MMKKISSLLLFIVFSINFLFALDCPYGLKNDPYPGQCGSYTDTDENGFCDYSQDTSTIAIENQHLEGSAHDCEEEIQHVEEGEISGEELKDISIHDLASLYKISDDEMMALLSTKVDVPMTVETTLRTLHDNHGLKMSTVKALLENLSVVETEGNDIEEIPPQTTNKRTTTIRQYLAQYYFQYLAIALLFTIMMFLLNHKYKKLVKWINIILLYGILPLFAIAWPLYIGMFIGKGELVFELGRHIGYASVWLLFFILMIKPICISCKTNSSLFIKKIAKYTVFVVSQRRALGIAIFYLALGHALVYASFWLSKSILTTMLNNVAMIVGIVAIASLFVAWLTSNNFSIKKLGKRRKPIQMISYLALIASVVHIFLINKETGLFLMILTGFYFVLKVFEWTKTLGRK